MTRAFLTFALILSICTSFACVQKGGNEAASNTGDTIKVGVYADLTGQTSSFGQSTKNGIELAVEEINNAGGVNGKKIELIVEDDQGRPEQAKTVVSKLINQDKVQAVLGEVASTNSLAAAPVAQEAKIPMITPSSTNPKVTEVGDYISRVCFIDPFQGSVMAKFAANTLKAKTAAILGDVNSDYSKGLTQFFEEEFTKLGGKVVAKEAYTQTDPDFKGQLTKIRNLNPDVIYIPGYYGQVGIIAKQARELDMNMPLLGGDGWDSPELWKLGGAALKNTYISNHYSAENPAPEIQNFVKAYKAKYNVDPDSLAALAYDAAKVLADAIKRAGGTDSAKLKDAINSTSNFPGVTGRITIDASRNAVKPAVVLELDPAAGKFKYKETIAPEGSASSTGMMNSNSNTNSMMSNSNSTGMSSSNMNSSVNSNASGMSNSSTSVNSNTTK
ncbi:MAG: ABC transporter substrate-binding protein [Pyrinomonadaceae bacterium]